MLVCVTGGTGFVGSHTVAALLREGCRVRLLVRDKAAIGRALAPHGIGSDQVEAAVGDVRDRASVLAALRGCDAVLHAASVYSFDVRRAAEMREVNRLGTEVVLDAAREAGVGRIIYVSSIVSLYPPPGGVLSTDAPVGRPKDVYMATKAAAEEVARRHQAEGAPVTIVYPPALFGPHDPHLGDQVSRVRDALRGLMPIWPLGGYPVGDVRDAAAQHTALLTGPAGAAERYFGPHHNLSTRRYIGTLRQVTGRRLPTAYLPGRAMLPVGRLADLAQRFWPWHIPAEYGAVYTCAVDARIVQDAPTYGIGARPFEETMADTVEWLHSAGRLTARQAGRPRHE
jgi:nucleoside-diphosphate-sugar epimerase